MFKKTLSLVTIAAFLFFDWACISLHKVPVATFTNRDNIVGLTKISGEYLQIPKEIEARIDGDLFVLKPTRIINAVPLDKVKDFRQDEKGVVYEITTKDGRTTGDIQGKIESGKIVLASLIIPLSDVKSISVRKIDVGKSILAILGILAGAAGLALYIFVASTGINL